MSETRKAIRFDTGRLCEGVVFLASDPGTWVHCGSPATHKLVSVDSDGVQYVCRSCLSAL